MEITQRANVAVWMTFVCIQIASPSFVLELQFFSYHNPTRAAWEHNGRCCEQAALSPPNCTSTCDNYFNICLKNKSEAISAKKRAIDELDERFANETCPYGWIQTSQVAGRGNKDNINFVEGQSLDRSGNTPNPIVFQSSLNLPSILEVSIDVMDEDGGRDDLIDIISIDISGISPIKTSPRFYWGEARYSFALLNYTLSCGDNFYGSDCSTFCVGRNDTMGHYTCDVNSGAIICNEGYTNATALCTECIPSEGCSLLGGYCDEPGQCICNEGFSGENCTIRLSSGSSATSGAVAIGVSCTVVALIILAGVGSAFIAAVIGEIKKRRSQKSQLNHVGGHVSTTGMLDNGAYITGPKHTCTAEFETSQNPGYRIFSLARQNKLATSFPGAQPTTGNTHNKLQREELIYSYPSTHMASRNLNQRETRDQDDGYENGHTHNQLHIETEYSYYDPQNYNSGYENERSHEPSSPNAHDGEYSYVQSQFLEMSFNKERVVVGQSIPDSGNERNKPIPLPRKKK